jgi:hypothetical protein
MEQLEEYNLVEKRGDDNMYGLTPQGDHVARLVVAAWEILKPTAGTGNGNPFENFGMI